VGHDSLDSKIPLAILKLQSLLLIGVAGALVWSVVDKRGQTGHAAVIPRPVTPRAELFADEEARVELYRRASPSVVNITTLSRAYDMRMNVLEIPAGTGSGIVWDRAGHIVTNYHVIESAQVARVTLADGSTHRATLVGVAADKDLAVLSIDADPSLLSPIEVGGSADLVVGQSVVAIGNPFGLDHTLTTGVISGLGREIRSVNDRPIQDVIQTDASINPGNSGGPLLDSAGRLIGVNTQIVSRSGDSAGVGFAVPVDTVNRIIPQLIRSGRITRPGIGIRWAPKQFSARHRIAGLLVWAVYKGSSAELAGLRSTTRDDYGRYILGDIIVEIDRQIVRSADDYYRILDRLEVGDIVELVVDRNGERKNVELTLQQVQ
jgi:S1-C subfamily serine protease